ncbi:SAM-dependent methyltransferase [Streptomyces sp. NPDC052236]|uniref:SAM-dependent methyltransferase n=1 Tax=Streptomyces sp. NPDC052236 TaxID=3365686 RepID=UPI0037D07337
MTDVGFGADEIDTTKPHSARVYDAFLGGKDNYPVDWNFAEQVASQFPGIRAAAQTNRAFMHRASGLLADRGIRQFLDIGTGIPTEPNLHQVVQKIEPAARVVYVDNDPIVLRHAEALLRGTVEGCTAYVHADFRDPAKIISAAREHLDFEKPIALSLVALLHFVPDEYKPHEIVRDLLEPLASGSYLVLSHVTGDFEPEVWDRIVGMYRNAGTAAQVRSRGEVATFFEGLELIDPGVEMVRHWYPQEDQTHGHDGQVPLYVGVARKT